jgi:hypothetical protein
LAHTWHQATQVAKWTGVQKASCLIHQSDSGASDNAAKNMQHIKILNFQTYKFHTLGDYVSTIQQYGMCDLYSTKPVCPLPFLYFSLWLPQGELEHHSLKSRYCHTDQRSFVKQLTQIEHQQVRIHQIGNRLSHRSHIKSTN